VIAAAVAELLARHPPEPLDLARHAYAGAQAQHDAAHGRRERDGADVPQYPPASWYLRAKIAADAEKLRTAARSAVRQVHAQVRAAAYERHPGGTRAAAIARGLFMVGELARQGLPPDAGPVPRGAIARMAIDRWARRTPDRVASGAVAYSAEVHTRPHGARSDMRTLSE
jgi:hypothetical protein